MWVCLILFGLMLMLIWRWFDVAVDVLWCIFDLTCFELMVFWRWFDLMWFDVELNWIELNWFELIFFDFEFELIWFWCWFDLGLNSVWADLNWFGVEFGLVCFRCLLDSICFFWCDLFCLFYYNWVGVDDDIELMWCAVDVFWFDVDVLVCCWVWVGLFWSGVN